jgi:hypothetical protein
MGDVRSRPKRFFPAHDPQCGDSFSGIQQARIRGQMTPTSRDRLRALGLTAQEFARLCDLDPVTVSFWGRERAGTTHPEPQWVGLLLDAWGRHPGLIDLARDAA